MFKNILCPIDFKPRSKMALKKAIHIAHQFNSRIVLLNIDERFKTKEQMVMSRISVSHLGDEYKKIAVTAKKEMHTLVKDLESETINSEYLVRDGVAEEVIVKISKEKDIDLIVMGTNGRDSLSDLILGSTTQKVVEKSICPVLVMPKGE